ncbi:hypothetical protein QQG55_38680 [Brugia pahangi]
MPKKKSGARKKAEKQREIRKEIQNSIVKDITRHPCNELMQCDKCSRNQKTRAFCYFCNSVNKAPICAACGKQKCFMKGGDCITKHAGRCVTGLQMMGALCDYCEAFICHSKKCLTTHPCKCPLRGAQCMECKRNVCEHGGRIYQCAFCQDFLCEDDQFEHQANCQRLENENFKCMSCNRFGLYTCLRCKVCCCNDHVRRKGFKYDKDNKNLPCPKCGYPITETKEFSISARKYVYARQTRAFRSRDDDQKTGKFKQNNKDGDFKGVNYDEESDDDGGSDSSNHYDEDDDVNHDDGDNDTNHGDEDCDNGDNGDNGDNCAADI